jgi:uncharacterized RmlC-like cupin family protein
MILRSQTEPGQISGWHHHGEYNVIGYLASGSARFEFGSREKEALSLHSGDFFHVPRTPSIARLTLLPTKATM